MHLCSSIRCDVNWFVIIYRSLGCTKNDILNAGAEHAAQRLLQFYEVCVISKLLYRLHYLLKMPTSQIPFIIAGLGNTRNDPALNSSNTKTIKGHFYLDQNHLFWKTEGFPSFQVSKGWSKTSPALYFLCATLQRMQKKDLDYYMVTWQVVRLHDIAVMGSQVRNFAFWVTERQKKPECNSSSTSTSSNIGFGQIGYSHHLMWIFIWGKFILETDS